MIRLVNSDNERDLNLLTRYTNFILSLSLHGEGGRWFVISAGKKRGQFLFLGANSEGERVFFGFLRNYFLGGLFVSSERKIEAITGL